MRPDDARNAFCRTADMRVAHHDMTDASPDGPAWKSPRGRRAVPAAPIKEPAWPVDERPALTTEQAAARLGIAAKSLHHMRAHNEGPSYFRVGRVVRYLPSDVDEYVRERRVQL